MDAGFAAPPVVTAAPVAAPGTPPPGSGAAPDDNDADRGTLSQTVRTQLLLRELIIGGELKPGVRIAELTLAERLGASRTPIRTALARLAEEGLLDALPHGGFAAKDFSEADIHDAIEVRGTLEGLAARLAAERGVAAVVLAEARDCLARIDALLARPELSDESFGGYVEQNGRFHDLLAEMAGSEVVARQLERARKAPFASPNGFVLARATGPLARDTLVVAQNQHRGVVDAIVRREGARAEALMREHARIAQHNLTRVLQSHQALQLVPGARLIRRRAAQR